MEFVPDRSGLASVRVEAEEATAPRLADAILGDAITYVPVLTGDLRASGHIERAGSTVYVVFGSEDVDYAAYQEFGTSKMAAQPYLAPAAYKARDL